MRIKITKWKQAAMLLLMCISVVAVYAQEFKNIGEFNLHEEKIWLQLDSITKSLDPIYYKLTEYNPKFTKNDFNTHIAKIHKLVKRFEERILHCQNALKTLPEPNDITSNFDLKGSTESRILTYQTMISDKQMLKLRIKELEMKISKLK